MSVNGYSPCRPLSHAPYDIVCTYCDRSKQSLSSVSKPAAAGAAARSGSGHHPHTPCAWVCSLILAMHDILQAKIGKHNKGSALISERTKAAQNGKGARRWSCKQAGGATKRSTRWRTSKPTYSQASARIRAKAPPPPRELLDPALPQGRRAGTPALLTLLSPNPNTNGKRNKTMTTTATATAPTAPTAPTDTTTLLGRWLKTAEVRGREMKPD
jgi:hypothetical protein